LYCDRKERYENLPKILKYPYSLKRKMSITPERMAETYLYLAAAPEVEEVTGKFFDENNRQVPSSKYSYDEAAWKQLWDESAKRVQMA
jgi:hypothetical protein